MLLHYIHYSFFRLSSWQPCILSYPLFIHMSLRARICICIYIYIHIYICVCVYVCVCVYIYIRVYISIYIYDTRVRGNCSFLFLLWDYFTCLHLLPFSPSVQIHLAIMHLQSKVKLPSITSLLNGIPPLEERSYHAIFAPQTPIPQQPMYFSLPVLQQTPSFSPLRMASPTYTHLQPSVPLDVLPEPAVQAPSPPSPPNSVSSTPPVSKKSKRSKCTKCSCKGHTASGHRIPRPRNAFILFRQHLHQSLFPSQYSQSTQGSFKTNCEVSREIGQRWRQLSNEERQYWNDLSKKEKELHKEKYPDYKYTPRKTSNGRRKRKDGCEYCRHDGNPTTSSP